MADLISDSFNYLGGINTSRSRTEYPKGEGLKSLNMRHMKGFVKRRKGDSKFNSAQMAGGGDILGLHDFRHGSSGSKFIEQENTVMYTDDGTTRASIKTGLTAGYYGIYENFDDFMWWCNGVDTPLKYDGTTVTNASIAQPAVGSFAISGQTTGGNLTLLATYKLLVTFYNNTTGQESQPFTLASAPSITLTGSNNAITALTGIPTSADTQVTQRRIYRTAGNDTVYNARLAYTLTDNTTTTINAGAGLTALNVADASLGDLIELNHDAMPLLTKFVKHNDKFFGFTENSSRLYVSRPFNAWYWPQGLVDLSTDQEVFYIDIDPSDGDKITNVVSYYNYLVVFKYNSIHIIEGYDFYELSRRKLLSSEGVGCVGKRAAVAAPDGFLYFIDKNGIQRTNGQIVQYQNLGDRVEAYFDATNVNSSAIISGTYISDCLVHVDNTRPNNNIRFCIPTGSNTANNKTLVFNYIDQQWSEDSGYNTQSLATRRVSGKDVLYRGDDYGYVWTCDQIEGDGGTINGTASSGTALGLIDTDQNMTTDAYKGCYLEILSGTGEGQRVKITHNTDTCFASTTGFSTIPTTDSVYTVGGIDGVYIGPFHNYGNASRTKNLSHVLPKISSNGNYSLTMSILYDFQSEDTAFETQTLTPSSESVWDSGLWDIARWDNPSLLMDQLYTAPNNIHRYSAVGFKHKEAGEGFTVYGYDRIYSDLGFGIR